MGNGCSSAKSGVKAAVDVPTAAAKKVGDAATTAVKAVPGGSTALDAAGSVAGGVASVSSGVNNAISSVGSATLDAAKGAAGAVGDVAGKAASATAAGVSMVPGGSTVVDAVSTAADVAGAAGSAALGAVGAVGNAVAGATETVVDTAVSGIEAVPGGSTLVDGVSGAVGAAVDVSKAVVEKTGDAIDMVPGGVIVTGAVGVAVAGAAVVASTIVPGEGEKEGDNTASTAAEACTGAYPPNALADSVQHCPDWIKKGLGDSEYICEEKGALFSAANGCPDEMPDFSEHCSFMAEILKAEPELYHSLKGVTTSMGTNLGHVIKAGVDNKGHPFIKTVGVACGDEESYTTFAPLLDKIISARHKGFSTSDVHKTNMDMSQLDSRRLDPTGKYVMTVRVRTGRSIRGFRLPPLNDFEERRKLEQLITKGLGNLEGDLAGEYFPLTGSRSYAAKPNGMPVEYQDSLREMGSLFQEPDSTLLLSSGCGRHWPDARGIFHNKDKNCFVWANEEDHMRIISFQTGDDMQAVCHRFAKLCDAVQTSLKNEGYDFMHSERLGYILTCPSNLGTGLRAGCWLKIPLASQQAEFKNKLEELELQARGMRGVDSCSEEGIFDISNRDRLGKSEVELINVLINGIITLIDWEKELEGGAAPAPEAAAAAPESAPETAAPPAEGDYPPQGLAESVKALPAWIQAGCGDTEYICEEKGATFPGDECPAAIPDLSDHNNIMAEVLRENTHLWDQLKDQKTNLGVGLAKCIKTGVDNKGHPHIKTVGLVGGDEDSYTLFKDLFDPVISARHGGYAADAVHPTNLNLEEMDTTRLDETGKYVLTARVRTGRSVRGFRLPPACSFDERRELERIIVKGLARLSGDLAGEYFPLHGSRSFAEKPNGMSKEKEEELRNSGNLFQEPDSTLLLSSGCGRHWPDSRGIFHNNDKNAFVWVNEEDHMRIVSMQKGDDIQAVFARFVNLSVEVQNVLKEEGADFMHSEHLGYILACPSNLGTGLRAGCLVQVPLLSAREDFKAVLGKMGLQARGGGGVDSDAQGGIYDISNADRLGKSEIDLVNIMIRGVSTIVKWEQALEAGESIDDQLP